MGLHQASGATRKGWSGNWQGTVDDRARSPAVGGRPSVVVLGHGQQREIHLDEPLRRDRAGGPARVGDAAENDDVSEQRGEQRPTEESILPGHRG
jgi:hypothetical protein